jgi:hypothetical protein
VTVSKGELTLNVPPCFVYRAIRKESIVKAYVTDYGTLSKLKPVIRTFGTGWPGYYIGWFKLANGADALLLVRGERVLILKLKEGIYVFLAPPDFERFLEVFEKNVMPIGESH